MAFFNLTKLGVEDPISSVVKNNEGLVSSSQQSLGDSNKSSPRTHAASTKINHDGSYVRYTEKLTKHQRSPYDPNEIFSKPVTSSQEYGWWRKDGAPESLPWTKVQRYSRVNSEMTRFVDEMTLTNKHFTLF